MGIAAVVGASEFNAAAFEERWRSGSYDYLVAVDGGFAHLESVGAVPDIAIGDFDSLGYVPSGVPVEAHTPCKAASDMELGLRHLQAAGHSRAHVYGALGGRLDHTVANLQLLALLSEEGMELAAIGNDQVVAMLTGPGALELPRLDQGTVSVFSMSDEVDGLLEEGMRYAFDSPRLTNRSTRGLSNELIGKPARVTVGKGTLVIFHPLA